MKFLSLTVILIFLISGCTPELIDKNMEPEKTAIEDIQRSIITKDTEDELVTEKKEETIIEKEKETISVEVVYLDLAEPTEESYFIQKNETIKIEIKEEEEMLFDIISKLMVSPKNKAFYTMFPERTELLEVKLVDGTLNVNLSSESLYGGSSQEMGVVEQVIKTAKNINQVNYFGKIDSVMFLIDGEIKESMMGHMEIGKPISLEERI